MLEAACKLLKEIKKHSYQAYIVGGFVRDYLLGIESNDIDIATDATPKELKEMFEDSCLPSEDYGAVIVVTKGIRFEITTFRKEIEYIDHRKPVEIEYIHDLREDLLRRDFSINTLCMNENGEVLDYLDAKKDLDAKIIRSIGDPIHKFQEDSLRILRAIRFATILDFELDEKVKQAILRTKDLIKDLSYYRKKMELDKIFTSPNYQKGVKLLLELGLEEELEIPKLREVLNCGTISLIGIWSILNVEDKYPFQKSELEQMEQIHEVLPLNNLDFNVLYQYGLYVNSVAWEMKGKDIKDITEAYNRLAIKSKSEIDVDSETIMTVLHKQPGKYLKEIFQDIEKAILSGKLENKRENICHYIIEKYQ
ncbi:MAG: hypothetical protein IJI60_03595 [Bacilli bacterium]|nr:hypothetical protein [Bacilli bacterium]